MASRNAGMPAVARATRLRCVADTASARRFATDWPDYAAWVLERLLRSPDFTWTAEPVARMDDCICARG